MGRTPLPHFELIDKKPNCVLVVNDLLSSRINGSAGITYDQCTIQSNGIGQNFKALVADFVACQVQPLACVVPPDALGKRVEDPLLFHLVSMWDGKGGLRESIK